MNNKNYPISRRENIVMQELENEVLLYDLTANKAFCLNVTSALVWQLCDGNHSVVEISRILSQKLNGTVSEDFVWLALEQLKREKLLTKNENLELNFNGLSRREVIRKVGLASMVALPIISSVIAPTATNAQSQGCVPNPIAVCPNGTFQPCAIFRAVNIGIPDCMDNNLDCCSQMIATIPGSCSAGPVVSCDCQCL